MKTAREKYYYDLLQVNKNNLSKVWQIINELIGKSKQDRLPTFFMKNDVKIENDDIAEEFNNYFSNIASLAQSKLNQSPKTHFSSYLSHSCNKSIYLYPTCETEIINVVKKNEKF